MPSAYDVNAPNRARMLNLARALGWPRTSLAPRRTSGQAIDTVGPGVTPWYLLAEQFPDSIIDDAIRNLLAPAPPAPQVPTAGPASDPTSSAEELFETVEAT